MTMNEVIFTILRFIVEFWLTFFAIGFPVIVIGFLAYIEGKKYDRERGNQ